MSRHAVRTVVDARATSGDDAAAASFLDEHRELLESVMSEALKATLVERPSDPVLFMAEHIGGSRLKELHDFVVATTERQDGQLQSQAQQIEQLQSELAALTAEVRVGPHTAQTVQPSLFSTAVQPALQTVPPASSDRLLSSVADMQFGSVSSYQDGLTKRIGSLRRSILQEFQENEGGLWMAEYEYVVGRARQVRHAPDDWQAGAQPCAVDAYGVVRDQGHDGWSLDDFHKRPEALAANLSVPEVATLRLYTGPVFNTWNFWLRYGDKGLLMGCDAVPYWQGFTSPRRRPSAFFTADEDLGERCKLCGKLREEHTPHTPCDWCTSVAVLYGAVVKLSLTARKSVVYRGVREDFVKLPDSFLPPLPGATDAGFRGGVEPAFMSTTEDAQVALNYSGERQGVPGSILEIHTSLDSRGAPVQWISQCAVPPAWARSGASPHPATARDGPRPGRSLRPVFPAAGTLTKPSFSFRPRPVSPRRRCACGTSRGASYVCARQ